MKKGLWRCKEEIIDSIGVHLYSKKSSNIFDEFNIKIYIFFTFFTVTLLLKDIWYIKSWHSHPSTWRINGIQSHQNIQLKGTNLNLLLHWSNVRHQNPSWGQHNHQPEESQFIHWLVYHFKDSSSERHKYMCKLLCQSS